MRSNSTSFHILRNTHIFQIVLGIQKTEASENACKIEHIVSQNLLNEMKDFTKFCQNHTEILELYKKEKQNQ